MAGEVHPVPFRTRKLSPPAPMVLRRKSVGEQDVADQRGAFPVPRGAARAPGGPPALGVGHGMRPCLAYAPSPPRDALPSCPAAARRLNSIKFSRPGPSFFILCVGPPGPALCVGRAREAPLCVGRRAAAPRGSPPSPRVVCKPWRRPAPLAGGGAGAYINSSRDGAAADAGGPSAGRTLRTGYRDRRGRASYRQHYYLGWLASARQAPRRFLSLNGR